MSEPHEKVLSHIAFFTFAGDAFWRESKNPDFTGVTRAGDSASREPTFGPETAPLPSLGDSLRGASAQQSC